MPVLTVLVYCVHSLVLLSLMCQMHQFLSYSHCFLILSSAVTETTVSGLVTDHSRSVYFRGSVTGN